LSSKNTEREDRSAVTPLVECVPNFSEGRDAAVIESICEAVRGVTGVRILDVAPDADHNRTVVTFIAPPAAAGEAAFAGCARAAGLIDLGRHRGGHPRIGATDVIPFVPLRGASMKECIGLARSVGERVARELDIPVYLYEEAAARPENRDLGTVRRGQFEGLSRAIGEDPSRRPDFGPPRLHPTAGATVVGARMPLIAFNVNLERASLKIAREIARAVRASSGGLPFVKAIGLELEGGRVQVSMNLTNYQRTPVWLAYSAVAHQALARGARVAGAEVIGLVPAEALLDVARQQLGLLDFQPDQVLELRLAGEDEGDAAE